MAAPRLIAFDVNETLLDLSALDSVFAQELGDAGMRPQGFAQMLQVAFTGAITGRYVDFPTAQESALHMVAERTGVALPVGAVERVAAAMRALPAHADAAPALDRLRAAGLPLFALGNSPLAVMRAQLEHAGLAGRFEALLSADEVRALKPRREAYELAARHGAVRLADVLLVAAHSWDVAGALAAGCRAAFLARPGMPLDPLGARPELVAPDLEALADRLLEG
jgi:2-haloacid dehalogenase